MELKAWHVIPAAVAALCWQTTTGTGGEDCYVPVYGTGAQVSVNKVQSDQTDIAIQIDALKQGLRLSYSEVGKIFGVSRQTVHNWLRGENIQAAHQNKLSIVIQGFEEIRDVLKGRKEFLNDRVLVGEKNLVTLLAENRFEAFQLLRDLLSRSDQRVAVLKQHLAGKDAEIIPNHFDPLD